MLKCLVIGALAVAASAGLAQSGSGSGVFERSVADLDVAPPSDSASGHEIQELSASGSGFEAREMSVDDISGDFSGSAPVDFDHLEARFDPLGAIGITRRDDGDDDDGEDEETEAALEAALEKLLEYLQIDEATFDKLEEAIEGIDHEITPADIEPIASELGISKDDCDELLKFLHLEATDDDSEESDDDDSEEAEAPSKRFFSQLISTALSMHPGMGKRGDEAAAPSVTDEEKEAIIDAVKGIVQEHLGLSDEHMQMIDAALDKVKCKKDLCDLAAKIGIDCEKIDAELSSIVDTVFGHVKEAGKPEKRFFRDVLTAAAGAGLMKRQEAVM